MLLDWAHFHNIGPFKDYRFEVGSLRGLVALCAPNGTGKTFSVEAGLLGAAYRKLATQGTLVGRATARDAWVESRIIYKEPFTVRQVVDGVSRASETLLLGADGAPLLGDTKVSTYDAWAEQNLPVEDVFLAGPFCVQKSEGFAGMKSGARIALILRVLGVARLERAAELARAQATAAETKFRTLVDRIAETRGDVQSVEVARAALEAARVAARAADDALGLAQAALATAQKGTADRAVRKTAREAADKLVVTLRDQLAGAAKRRAEDEGRLAGNRLFQAEADAIRAAAGRLESENANLTRLELALAEAGKAIAAELSPWRDAPARLKAAEQRRAAAETRLRDEAGVLAAVASKVTLQAAVEAERAAVAALETELAQLEAVTWAGADERFAGLRQGYREILDLSPARIDEVPLLAEQRLAADDAAITAAVETPKQLADLKARLKSKRAVLTAAEKSLAEADKLGARLPDMAAAKADLAAAQSEAADIRQGHALGVLGAFARSLGRLELAAAARAAGAALEVTRKLAKRLEPLNDSDRRIAELEESIAAAKAEESRVEAQIASVELLEVGEAPDVASFQESVNAATEAAKTAAANVVKAEQGLARADEVAAKVAALEVEREAAADELADWTRLGMDLGRKGIQSAEVDSAGPELTELANDLLHRCHGPRYTVEVKTQRLDSKGKNLVDECTVMVTDSELGTRKEVSEHSGGEGTILAEALSLALTMMGCRRAGFSDFTIVRDESGAALDPANNRAYVAMLRQAMAITGARHVLLVSHSEDVQRMCDHRIEIPNQRRGEPAQQAA